jgi:tetratricopeptide (TPR) repeat protein
MTHPALRRTGFLLCLCLFLLRPAAGDDAPLTMRGGADPRIQQGIDLIYQLHLDDADAYFARIIEAEPANLTGYFFRAMVAWWRVLLDLEDRSHDEFFYARLQECIDVCDARLQEDPDNFDAILFKGGAVGFRGRLRGDRHQFVHAARDGLRSLPLLTKSRQLDPENKDILFGQGIYNYFADVIPEKQPVVRPVMLFLPDGDRDLGLQQLREVGREGRYARTEAIYFVAQIHRVFEDDDAAALPYLEELQETYPRNALFHRYRARTLIALGRWEEGIAHYEEVRRRSRDEQAGYHTRGHIESLYYLGKNAFRQRHHDEALRHFTLVDSLARTLGPDPDDQAARGYTALANLYLGMTRDELGRREAAQEAFRRVLDLPAQGRSHELAKAYRKDPYRR